MATTTKALSIARELIDVLSKKVAATLPVVVQTFDTDGNPVVTFSADSTPVTTEKVVVIRVLPFAWTAVDILGNAAQKFTPHVIEICTEANPESGADILTPVELLPILSEIAKRGCQMKWYVSSAGDVPAETELVAANLVATDQDLYWNVGKAQ